MCGMLGLAIFSRRTFSGIGSHSNESTIVKEAISMSTYKQLTAQLAKVQAQMEAARDDEVAAVVAQIKQRIAEYDITPEELGFASKRTAATKSGKAGGLPPKYRNPKTGQTWSGRGRVPSWLGKRRERFLID
jgi:DNA-binding protein H-NS